MSLGHVYIVLEPVGSSRLKFGDDRYYEFRCFDVLKVVRSPVYDHGHDEESRNGRGIKINILDGYIRITEVFRVFSEKTGVSEGYRNPPGEIMGHMGLSGEREPARAGRAPPPPWVRIGLGKGGAAPPFPSPSLLLPSSPTPTRKRGSPTPGGSRTPPWHALPWPVASSPPFSNLE